MSHGIHTTARVWLKTSNLKWIAGTVDNVGDKFLSITTEDGQHIEVPRGSDKLSQRTPAGMEMVDNLTTLPDLDEPNMLHSLNARYKQNLIYTRTGPILVALNPWQDLSLYGNDVMQSYRRRNFEQVPPHVFAIAEAAFSNLQSKMKDQTILVSGDSGSGKTESTKFMMQYLATVANHTVATANTEQQVLQCNPVLEAFGNAKTLRNDNSSRFGKYIDIHFDEHYALCGAKIDTYLLEKSRVVGQEPGERNFHIFYQLCSQTLEDPDLSKELDLRPAEQFRYIAAGAQVAVAYKPATSFSYTRKALEAIGIAGQETLEILKVLAAVMHLGEVTFSSDKDQNAVMANPLECDTVARLLGCEAEELRSSFVKRKIQAGPQDLGDAYTVSQTEQQAVDTRDALARAVYGSLFDALVRRINLSLSIQTKVIKTRRISILDIFGFEHFKTNHFEQFCINYANEKLQLHFNHFNFMLERQLYAREGIELVESDFVDNSACVELIEGRGWGIQACLDDVCIMPKGDDQAFLQKISQQPQIKSSVHWEPPKQRNNMFCIKHYAGNVSYDIEDFCEKNKDSLVADVIALMLTSKSKFFVGLFEAAHDLPGATPIKPGRKGGGGGSVAYKSVSATFKTDLSSLMEAINAADPHFVRCVNPNAEKKAECFQDQKAVEQLRCGGVIEAVRMSRESYPSRFAHQDFIGTFTCICPQAVAATQDPKSACLAMMKHMKIDPKKFRLGSTMILLKREVVDSMEKERARLLGGRAIVLQATARTFLARAELSRKREARLRHEKILLLQSTCRRSITRMKYSRMVQAMRLQEKKKREEAERKKKEEEDKKRQAAAQAQAAAAANNAAEADRLRAAEKQRVETEQAAAAAQSRQVAANSRAAVLEGLDDDDESGGEDEVEVEGCLEDNEQGGADDFALTPAPVKSNALTQQDDVPPVSPLCIRIQVHAEGITEALLFHVDLLASAIRQAVTIKDNKAFFKVHPNTFRGQAAIDWLRGHAARALFGSEAEKEKNQQLSRSVALLLGQKLLAVGVFRQVTGSLTKPLEDPNALFRFHEDEKEGPLLNCRSIWFQNAREPLLVVSELLYTMLNLRLAIQSRPGNELKDSEELNNFTAAAAELQLVNINDLTRIQLLAFFLNAYNLMVLHAHTTRGQESGREVKAHRAQFLRDNQYMVAAYNYSLEEIEERLFCRDLRAKFPKKSDKSRAPEPRVHFALSLGCASSPRIRIYQPESLDEDLQQAAIEYLTTNAPKNRARLNATLASKSAVAEVIVPKLFKWYKDDFGFSKQEILAYYASFMPDGMRDELMEVARSNNFVIKYDKFDWNLHLTKACSEASRQPRQMIQNSPANSSPSVKRVGDAESVASTLGANQVFTPSLHESGQAHSNLDHKVMYSQQQAAPTQGAPPGQGGRGPQYPPGAPAAGGMRAPPGAAPRAGAPPGYRVPGAGGMAPPPAAAAARKQPIAGLQEDNEDLDGFMC
mmetsp:Transcript_8727/g.20286  ORF Transcript_8727/g.20286 Transcript_8727/m.20286 type:complete len:1478 (+) Transcript_8727:193-4626(+)